jgi:peptide/nickel transport system permease protein
MRTSTLIVTRHDYVAGARARGASHLRVLVTHVVPNALGPVVVQASVLSAFALQLEAGLSFLGLGTQPPTPSLGGMLSDGRDVLIQAPWVEIFPGLAIVVAVLGFTFLAKGCAGHSTRGEWRNEPGAILRQCRRPLRPGCGPRRR